MKTWTSDEAGTRLDEILDFCIQEPQLISKKNRPSGVIINIAFFEELMRFWQKPTIADLLDELGEIKMHETDDIEIPERTDRSV
ncbi:type II toxin-antitoxin system Phd/YefM family antitoxin [Desulfococcaceae bacterium HSG8]|nr:type II toxin-antitoxin system Phd/YefM family antitoxin [Desulfococcaceae bacterium HSG8]